MPISNPLKVQKIHQTTTDRTTNQNWKKCSIEKQTRSSLNKETRLVLPSLA